MHDGGVFDADLHNKRLQVHGLFGPGAMKMRSEPLVSVQAAQAPQVKCHAFQFPSVIADVKCNGVVSETSVGTKTWLVHGTLLAVHAGVFLALLAYSTISFAVILHAIALTWAPALALSVEDTPKRSAALLVHLAGVASLWTRTPALEAEVLSPAFYVLFAMLLLARIAGKVSSSTACVSRMCLVFYVLHFAALLAIVALFAVRETVAKDPRDRAALDLTATVTAGIVLACHVLF
jgi:hypothetical protein